MKFEGLFKTGGLFKMRKYVLLALPLFLLVMVAQGKTLAGPGKDEKPSKTVTAFLSWYQKNQARLSQMNLVLNYVNGQGPNGKNYEVDYNGVEKYLTEIKKSTFIHAKYVEKWRKYFKKCEEDFKANPQNAGPPKGFDYDLVMLTQEFDRELGSLDKLEIKSEVIESNNYALVMIKFTSGRVLKYELAKQNNKWLITDISI